MLNQQIVRGISLNAFKNGLDKLRKTLVFFVDWSAKHYRPLWLVCLAGEAIQGEFIVSYARAEAEHRRLSHRSMEVNAKGVRNSNGLNVESCRNCHFFIFLTFFNFPNVFIHKNVAQMCTRRRLWQWNWRKLTEFCINRGHSLQRESGSINE